ncbi:DUF2062 domain-containing protein [Brevibacillus sp. SYP-B805]|uniref:DUF2062 domain-containing protein n=1 Tax=Brevibacillus sp. SYP-B805 TaxID=1578199 RepID=UPI0013EBE8DB|nr:DUF2062 domain-containing protein [Brevibacillus sp. SYP-B805]NGQ95365.1 DUF2062 domain-containing protein [Brevibacillus sp. SYP-B805]
MFRKLMRKAKYEYYKLIRMKGAPSFIARGFSVGIFIEFITLPTFGLAFILLYPMNLLFRSSFSAALIGFVIGKLVLPVFMILNFKLGNTIIGKPLKEHIEHNHGSWKNWIAWMKQNGLAYFTGSAIMGVIVAIGSYFLVYAALQWYRKKKGHRRLGQENS